MRTLKTKLFLFCCVLPSLLFAQQPELVLPAANSNQLQAVAISRSEKYIASADLDGKIKIWEHQSGRLIKTLIRDNIYELAFTPDEKKLVIASFTPPEVYFIETGETRILGDQEYCEGLSVSPDGKWIAIGSEKSITLWDAVTLEKKNTFHSSERNSEVRFSPDSKMLVLFGKASPELWSLQQNKIAATLKGHTLRVIKVQVSKDNLQVLTASDDKTAMLWDIKTGKLLVTYTGHQETVWDAKFHPDNNTVITASGDNTGRLWEKNTGKYITTLQGHPDWVYNIAVSPDGKTFALSDAKGFCSVWDAQANKFLKSFRTGVETLYFLNYLQGGNKILAGNYDPVLSRWDILTGKKDLEFGTHNDRLTSIHVSNDEKNLLVTSRDGVARMIDAATGAIVFYKKVFKNNNWATSADFNADDSRILVAGGGSPTSILNRAGGEEAVVDDYSQSYESYSKFSPDGKYILHVDNFSVQLIRVSDNKRLWTTDSISMFTTQRFSPDGAYMITGGANRVRIWSVTNQRMITEAIVSTPYPANIEISYDSKYFLCVNNDEEKAEIWEVSSGKKIRELTGINFVGFMPGGKLRAVYMSGKYTEAEIASGKETYSVSLPGFHRNVEYHFLKNGKFMVTKSASRVEVRELGFGKLLRTLTGNEISYTPAGNFLYLINDDLMEIHDLDKGSMMYRHFIIGEDDYLVQDTKGRFDGTEAARKILYFVCGAEVIELEQAKDQLWVPQLAERVMKGEAINAKTMADLNICNLSPLVESNTINTGNYSFKITPRRGGLGETVLYVNGIEAKRFKVTELKKGQGYYDLTVSKTELNNFFAAGKENLVTVKSFTADNGVSSRGLIVKEEGSSKTVAPPNLYAVMIGVSDYKGSELDLKYAAKDATDISAAVSTAARKLLNTDGKEHVFVYNLTTDKDRYQFPEKNAIRKILADIGAKATANDILFIFFAGHGIMSGEETKKQFYFLTADASTLSSTEAVKDVGISTSELIEWMKPQFIKAQKRILVFDACNSGQAINDIAGKDLGVRNDDKAQQVKAIDKLNEKSGLFILSASASNQSAYEMGRYSQGLLTYSLLRAIKQQPDILEENKYLNVSRWFNAAEKSVAELSRENGARQEPQVVTNTNFNIGLVDESVIASIKLPAEKPLFAASNFQNSDEAIADDDLEISKAVNMQLSDLSARGGEKGIIYVTATNSPDAYSLSGRYTVSGNQLTLTVNLKQNKTIKQKFEVSGTKDKLELLAESVVQKATRMVE